MTATPARRAAWVAGAGIAVAVTAPFVASPNVAAFVDAELIDAEVSGTVFIDFDRDGRVDPGEVASDLVSGQRITVASPNRQERARTAADGTFSLSLPNLLAADGIETGLRVEVDVPVGHRASFRTASVQHVRVRDGDDVEVLFGFVPDSRCPDDPATLGDPSGRSPDGHPNAAAGKLWTTCFVDGAAQSDEGAQDVLVATNIDNPEWEPPPGSEFGGHLDVEHLATKQQMGAIWGLAYDEWDGLLFASAVVKRHSDLGPEGIDGLYWRSSDAAVPEISAISLDTLSPAGAPGYGTDPVDCPRGDDGSYDYEGWSFDATARGQRWDCRDLGVAGGGSQSFDWWAFDRVGREGIGDIDVTPDGHRLLVLNATADAVFVYDVATMTADPAAPAVPTYVTHHDVRLPECSGGVTEAWGLRSIDASAAYVGATCTAESTGSTDDLFSHVLRMDLATGAVTTAVVVDHDHQHGPGYVEDAGPNGGRFQPWLAPDAAGRPVMPPLEQAVSVKFLDFIDAYGYANSFDWHQPLLSDIEIDPADGSLTIAVMDRWSMMTGVFNCDLDPSDGDCGYEFPAPPAGDYDGQPGDDPVGGYTGGIIGYVAGDLLRACNVAADPDAARFVLEGGDGCDPSVHSPTFDEPFGGGPAGPFEWYWNDQAFTGGGTDNPHPEAAMGAVAQPSRGTEVAYTAMNPTETFGAGLSLDAHLDGVHVAGVQFFRTDFRNSDGRGWKSAGLGDVEGCRVPLEIGDHVWLDESVDGVRDPDEPPILGVEVTLIDATSQRVVATTFSDVRGNWSFDTSVGLEPLTEYLVRFTVGAEVSVGDVSSFELVPTIAGAPNTRADLDSDLPTPEEPGLPFEIEVVTGPAGASDHTIDAGFAPIGELDLEVPDDDDRPGPPWRTLGLLFVGLAVGGAVLLVILRRFVW